MTTAQAKTNRLYFVSPAVDWLAMGGLSIVVWLLLRAWHTGERTDTVITLGMQLAWVVNWPHFAATSYRLYQSPDHVRQYPLTAIVLPFVIVLGVVAAFASPDLVAPFWAKFFLIWSPWHFSGQTFGVTMLYARRGGWRIDPWLRRGLLAFIFGTFLVGTVGAETYEGGLEWYGIDYPALGLPAWTIDAATALMYAGLAVVVVQLVRAARREKRFPPAIILLPAAAQYLWFVGGSNWQSFTEFVPLFHSLQYLLIAWSMQLQTVVASQPSKRNVAVTTARWCVANFAGGVVLFYILPLLATTLGYELTFATAVIIAGVQIHHFFVDGVIWRLRSTAVTSPLMGTFTDVIAGPPKREAA